MRAILSALLCIPLLCSAAQSTEQRPLDKLNSNAIKKHSQKLSDGKELALTHQARGDAHLQRSEFKRAISAYDEALLLDSTLDTALLHRALAFGYDKQYAASIKDLSLYIERKPDSSLAYTKRGLFYFHSEEIYKAVKDFERAIELDKNNAEAYDDLGVIYVQGGKLDKARTYFRAATSIDPSYAKAWHNMALASFLSSELDTALQQVDRALSLQPDEKQALMLKSVILEQQGDTEAARHFEALANSPD